MTGHMNRDGRTEKRVTVRDVARAAGVAIATVSRVVNGVPTVAEDVRAKVLVAIEQLGWTPSAAAQTMRGISTRMVGFIFSDIRNPLYSAMIKGAEEVLSEHGYILMVASSNGIPQREMELLALFKRRGADGLIFSVADESNSNVAQSLKTIGLPVVLLEREIQALQINAVGASHLHGVRRATEYLISQGHTRIAMISGGKGNRVARDRYRGLEQAMVQAGISIAPELMKLDSFDTNYAYRETQIMLDLAEPPTAIIALGMHLLAGVVSATRVKGLSIPDDISLVASPDSELAQLASPAVTVIRYDAEALGREAARLLLRQLNDQHPEAGTRIEIPTELIVRASCSVPREASSGIVKRRVNSGGHAD